MIIEIPLDESIFQQAEQRLATMPVYKGSHRKNGANQTGVLGEIVTERWLSAMGIYYSADKTTQYDLWLLDKKTIDVKTKERSSLPRQSYDCSVALYNHEHQRPDYYVFVSLIRSKDESTDIRRFTHAYLLGGVDQHQLHTLGREIPKNTVDSDNGMQNWTSMLNIAIDKLVPCAELQKRWLEVSPNHSALFDYRAIPIPASKASNSSFNVSNKVF
jgi:hypothetical protein